VGKELGTEKHMTNQLQGELLFKGINEAAGTPEYVYSPWLRVMGDKATYAIEVLQITAGITVKWAVETRSLDGTSTAVLFSNVSVTATGMSIKEADTITVLAMDLVRYRISAGATPDVTKWALLRVLPPSWQRDR
jgi:hypothetical protein